ncbi:MAG: efflux RND transporter periplasmic adaptor subunit [Steroidobacteraceae bacterium]
MRVARWATALATTSILQCLAPQPVGAAPARTQASQGPGPGVIVVKAQPVSESFSAYAQAQPIALLPVRAVEAGSVTVMRAIPGSRVEAGDALATLAGPEIRSLITSREGALRSARAQLAAARRTLAIERRQLGAQLSTEQAVAAAVNAAAAASAAFATARAQLQTAQAMSTLRAPAAGAVVAVSAAEGEYVTAGQTVVTLQASDRLWLRAVYYGLDTIHVGMTGQFEPAAGGASVSVKVAAVAAALEPDGGESAWLLPTDPAGQSAPASHSWVSGERGTVTLTGATQSLIAVPTRALILDQARWWVLVRTSNGFRRQAVVPGPTRGWQTLIERGLSPGEQVVVENAYLEFHRGIAGYYTPPD